MGPLLPLVAAAFLAALGPRPSLSGLRATASNGSTPLAPQPTLIDLRIASLNTSTTLAIQACAGLLNRNASSPGVYTVNKQVDLDWLSEITGVIEPLFEPIDRFMTSCMHGWARGRWIRYNVSDRRQRMIVPAVATLAGVLDAVPLDDEAACGHRLVLGGAMRS